jgi:hypothetical protein
MMAPHFAGELRHGVVDVDGDFHQSGRLDVPVGPMVQKVCNFSIERDASGPGRCDTVGRVALSTFRPVRRR